MLFPIVRKHKHEHYILYKFFFKKIKTHLDCYRKIIDCICWYYKKIMNLNEIILNFVFEVLKKYTCTCTSINILRIKNMKTRNIADITHQWCLQMRAKAFDSRVGWGALNVLPRNGVSFLENEICILNIKSIFAHRKYFLYTFSKTWKVFGWRLTIVQEENNILVWNIILNCDLWRSKSRKYPSNAKELTILKHWRMKTVQSMGEAFSFIIPAYKVY